MSINVNSTQITALLQLYPMAIPGAVENLQPPGTYHLGIPESIHSPSTKLFMVIDPVTLFSTPFAAGDSVKLWVNSQATSVIKNIYPGEENDRIFMELLWGVLKNGLNTLYYEVTRVSGNKDKSNPILNVLFNNPVSGITVSHPANIGPGQSAAVTLTRSDPRQFDDVELTIGPWRKTIPYVHPANPITYNLTTLDLQQIGDGTRTVSATIKDQLSNLRVSPTTSIVITANTLVLPPPSVTGQTGSNFNPTLQNVEVVVPAGTLLPGDKIHVEWEGAIIASGASYKSAQQLVSAGLKFPVPRSVLAYSLGKVVKVIYVIERNGKPTSSQVLPLNILPLPATALVSPKILEADANNVLDVIALGTKNATIHALLWTLIADGMPCWLSLEGKKPDGTAHNLALWKGLPSQVNRTWVSQGFWPKALVNSYLKQLGDGTSLRIKFAVSMDMSNVRATALEFPDRDYTIKAVALIVPTIVNVNENTATGKPVANAGFTTATTLVISGKLSPGQQGELYDGSGATAQSLGKVTANAAGDYSITITVAQGAHRFSVKSLYHPGAVYSNVWTLTVVALVVPTIGNVNENTATGTAVANGGRTTATTLVIRGKLSLGQQGELYDGSGATAKPLGKVTANAAGDYSITITVAQGAHRFFIQSLYHPGTVYSNVWTLTVVALVKPAITKVKGTLNTDEIPNKGVTFETNVVLEGTAPLHQMVEILDGERSEGDATANGEGIWTKHLNQLAPGVHIFSAKAKYGNGQVSDVRSLRVFQPATIPVGKEPTSLAVFPDGTRVYVTNYGNNFLSVIDTFSQTVTSTIPVNGYPFGVAMHPDGRQAYLASRSPDAVLVIDTVTQKVIHTISVPDFMPYGVAISQDGSYACVPFYAAGSVMVINTRSQAVKTIRVGNNPSAVAFHPNSSKAYVVCYASLVSVIDMATQKVIQTIPLPTNAGAIAVTPNGANVYVGIQTGSTKVQVFDTGSLANIKNIPLYAERIATLPNSTLFYVNTGSSISVIDNQSHAVIRNIEKIAGAIAIHPDGTRLYVANRTTGIVSVIAAK